MSGGHFGFKERNLGKFAKVLEENPSPDGPVDEGKVNWNLELVCDLLYDLQNLLHEYDYWICGDTSESDYREMEELFLSKWEMFKQ